MPSQSAKPRAVSCVFTLSTPASLKCHTLMIKIGTPCHVLSKPLKDAPSHISEKSNIIHTHSERVCVCVCCWIAQKFSDRQNGMKCGETSNSSLFRTSEGLPFYYIHHSFGCKKRIAFPHLCFLMLTENLFW